MNMSIMMRSTMRRRQKRKGMIMTSGTLWMILHDMGIVFPQCKCLTWT